MNNDVLAHRIFQGDCLDILPTLPSCSVNLIVTSPPYADQRKETYGGVYTDKYVEWFLPIAAELKRVLKQEGSFILNIKERVVDGERHTYVLELILALRKQGWLWTEDISGISEIAIPVSGLTGFVMAGNAAFISRKTGTSSCIRMLCVYRWETGASHVYVI